jgi:alkaline phosphatase D
MTSRPITRRDALVQMGAGALAFSAPAFAQSAQDKPLWRIAFGSCARQNKDQPIWDSINAQKPDLFVFLGDNIYADTTDPEEMREKYAALAAKPGFQRLRATTPIVATWDDHDYGANDSGAAYEMKDESRRQFCDFWDEPADSARRTQEGGIFTARMFGPEGRRVQVILPDLRWNRQPENSRPGFFSLARQYLKGQVMRGRAIGGPYGTVDDPEAVKMLGAAQWRWLEDQLKAPADLRIIGSSLQVLSQGTGWEAWDQFPAEQARIERLIGEARNVVLISGDVHYGELSKLERANSAPLYELTSSGLTEVWATLPPNTRRVDAYRGRNFGVIDIDWDAQQVRLQVRDETGAERIAQSVAFA